MNEKRFTVVHIADVTELTKKGFKPIEMYVKNDFLRFVYESNEAFKLYQEVKAKRQNK